MRGCVACGERAAGDRGGQSREHALLARALGVTQLVVAVNKLDAPGVAWAESRFRDIVDAMTMGLRHLRDTGLAVRSEEAEAEEAEELSYHRTPKRLYDV